MMNPPKSDMHERLREFLITYKFTRCTYSPLIGTLTCFDGWDAFEKMDFTPGTEFYQAWDQLETDLMMNKFTEFCDINIT